MESRSMVGDFLSPESTVTSLLSSSGHLRSSLLVPEHNTTFRYRDKNFDSASAALDAYITDFEKSHQNSKLRTGKLVLPCSAPFTPSRPRVSTLRNKDVLKERLTERELDFLNLPVSSLHHRSNRDRLSMTTDELLSIPYDGSMPVTHTSAFIQGLLSQSEASKPCPPSYRPEQRAWDRLDSSYLAPQVNHHHPSPARTPMSFRCRGRQGAVRLKPEVDISSVSCHRSAHRAAMSEWAEQSSSLHLPHWLTSNKNDMDCSGITSLPDLKYPAWIQRCDLNEAPPPTESELWDAKGVLPPAAPRPRAPSWVAELEDEDYDQTSEQVDNRQTLRDLRLQFAEQISLLAAEKRSSDVVKTLFKDNRIETLIQKADQVLNTLSLSSRGADSPADPVNPIDCVETVSQSSTEKTLCGSSSHCHPAAPESAASVEDSTEALTDKEAQTRCCRLCRNSILKQPGPVEAMKQMLFRLQAVEAELQRQEQASVPPTLTDTLQTAETPVKQWPEAEAELETSPSGLSLQRALHHLSRLKELVAEPKEKHKGEEEEKDEDEGRFSSSSADGHLCTLHKLS